MAIGLRGFLIFKRIFENCNILHSFVLSKNFGFVMKTIL